MKSETNKRKLLLLLSLLLFLFPASAALADPTVTNEFPLCGSQGDPVAPTQNCTDYAPSPNLQVLTVPGAVGANVSVTFSDVWRSGIFGDELFLYYVNDLAGTVDGIAPTDPGYVAAAIHRTRQLFAPNVNPGTSRTLSLLGGDKIAFLLVQSSLSELLTTNPNDDPAGDPKAWFSVDAANPDHADHLLAYQHKANGSYQLAWEDWVAGGGDYNDMGVDVSFPAAEDDPLAAEGVAETTSLTGTFESPCGASTAIASPTASCNVADKCGSGRWGTIPGHASWKQLVTHLTFWDYYPSFQVCLDLKKGAILAFGGQTEVPDNVLAPIWKYDNNPRWTFGQVGPKVDTSFARVTDSFTGCPIINIGGFICRTVTVTLTWALSVTRGGPYQVDRSVVFF